VITVVPSLRAALVTQAGAALPTVRVSNGFADLSEDPADRLMVGVDDPFSDGPAAAANGSLDFATMRVSPSSREENGELLCSAVGRNGDSDTAAALAQAVAIWEAVDTLCRVNPALGLGPPLLWARVGSLYEMSEQLAEDGAVVLIVFRVAYRARV
jgi:hypothetical protein